MSNFYVIDGSLGSVEDVGGQLSPVTSTVARWEGGTTYANGVLVGTVVC